MNLTRRKWLQGASAFAIAASFPKQANAWTHGFAQPFNGGKSQIQAQIPTFTGDWPFLNLFKSASFSWQGLDVGLNSGAQIDPTWLDTDGYPLASKLSGTNGVLLQVPMPLASSFTDNLVLMWDVTGAGPSDVVTFGLGLATITPISGSLSSTGNGTSNGSGFGTYKFSAAFGSNGPLINVQIASLGGTAHVTNMRLVFANNLALSNQGKLFNPQFLSRLAAAKPGVWRFKDWTNVDISNTTTWATRKTQSYPTWCGYEWRATLAANVTTSAANATVNAALSSLSWSGSVVTATTTAPHGFASGKTFAATISGATPSGYNVDSVIATSTGASTFTYPLISNPGAETVPGIYCANCLDYLATTPGTYAWSGPNGNYTPGGAPVDKQTMHIRFNVDSMLVENTIPAYGGTLTISGVGGASVTFGWNAHPFNNGDPISINEDSQGGTPPAGTSQFTNYYVVNATTNSFQAALTPGGAAIAISSAGSGNWFITRLVTINLNSTGAIPIRGIGMLVIGDIFSLPRASFKNSPFSGVNSQIFATVTFDADAQTWMMDGGNWLGAGSVGLDNGVPIETCLQLCKEIGCHPHFNIPVHALDPATDYATSLATACQNSGIAWMIPAFEPSNEVWNGAAGFIGTPVAQAKAFLHWNISVNDQDNAYGKWVSVLGQGIASVYGRANLGTKYDVLCGLFTNGSATPNDRLAASEYVAQAAAPQSGYLKVAPTTPLQYVSAVSPANYVSPSMRGKIAELQNTWGYYVTNVGNSTAQMVNLNAYADTLSGAGETYNLNWVLAQFQAFQTWAAGFGVNKIRPYEGGYSPDLVGQTSNTGSQWNSPTTGATNNASCVLTLATTSSSDNQHNPLTGNPAAIGMALCVLGVGGAIGLNCIRSDDIGGATFTAGSASIAQASNTLIAGQAVVYRFGQTLPPNINAGQTYYVLASGLSGTAYQIATTPGGTAIIAGGTGTYGVAWDSGWAVTAVSGNSVTVNCVNAPGVWTSGGTAYYLGSSGLVNNFRVAVLNFATDLQALLKTSYDNVISTGGQFPSQYEFSGTNAIWPCIQGDIWSTVSQEYLMIQTYNN